MASKSSTFPLIISALALLPFEISSPQHEDKARPVIHFCNIVPYKGMPHVGIQIEGPGIAKSFRFGLKAGKSYELKTAEEGVYRVEAQFGFKFTEFNAYDPARDNGHAVIFWRADNGGFDFSYDKSKWKRGATWELE